MRNFLLVGGVLAFVAVGLLLPRLATKTKPLDATEIKCAQNLKGISVALNQYKSQHKKMPTTLAELKEIGVAPDDLICPQLPNTNYVFTPGEKIVLKCQNHNVHRDGTPYRITSDLVVHISAQP